MKNQIELKRIISVFFAIALGALFLISVNGNAMAANGDDTQVTSVIEDVSDAKDASDIAYVISDLDVVSVGQEQKLAVAFDTKLDDTDKCELVLKNEATGEEEVLSQDKTVEDAVSFSFIPTDSQLGVYSLEKIKISNSDGDTNVLSLGKMKDVDGKLKNVNPEFEVISATAKDNGVDELVVTSVDADSDKVEVDSKSVDEIVGKSAARFAATPAPMVLAKASKTNAAPVVVIDPGHGGSDIGAPGKNGHNEKYFTLKISKELKKELEGLGYTVYMTRYDDSRLSENIADDLRMRCELAKKKNAAFFVSIHINSAASVSAKGVEVWVPSTASNYYASQVRDPARRVGKDIVNKLSNLGFKNRGIKSKTLSDRKYADGSRCDYLAVIRHCRKFGIPSILVEHGFIQNPSDFNKLEDPSVIKKMAHADAMGIHNELNYTPANLELVKTEKGLQCKDGSNFVTNKLVEISGNKYYFGKDGCAVKGLHKVNGDAYVFGDDYTASKGVIEVDGKTYYCGIYSGKIYHDGWHENPNNGQFWYLDKKTGEMYKNKWVDGYYMNEKGYRAKGIQTIDGKDYYFGVESGKLYKDGIHDDVITNKGRWYLDTKTGEMLKSQFVKHNGSYYYVDETGHIVTGVKDIKGLTYYFGNHSGKLYQDKWHRDWNADGEKYWYLDPKNFGAMRINSWINDAKGNPEYYVGKDGYRVTGLKTIEGKQYYFGNYSGKLYKDAWHRDWNAKGEKYWYLNPKDNGALLKNEWITNSKGEKTHYVGKDGYRVTGVQNIGKDKYYFGNYSGKLYKDGWHRDWNSSAAKFWYLDPYNNGVMKQDSWVTVGKNRYYVGSDYYRSTGVKSIDGKKYYFGYNSGVLYNDGWHEDVRNGGWWYLNKDTGAMATNEWIGANYYVGADGYRVTGVQKILDNYYYFGNYSGKLYKDGKHRDWCAKGEKYWYLNKNTGAMALNQWVLGSNNQPLYYAGDYSTNKGHLLTGVQQIGGKSYYFGYHSGNLYNDGWHRDYKGKGTWYLKENGEMLVNCKSTIDGKTYYFDKKGYVTSKIVANTEPIMGKPKVSKAALVKFYKNSNFEYPSTLKAFGAASIEEYCDILYDEAVSEGVRPEVLFSQVICETGYLQSKYAKYQNNFGGIGVTYNGAPGNTFKNVREGLRAQTQHLKAYASTQPLNNPCVDPRYGLVKKGCCKYVDGLGNGMWAASTTYASTLKGLLNGIYACN